MYLLPPLFIRLQMLLLVPILSHSLPLSSRRSPHFSNSPQPAGVDVAIHGCSMCSIFPLFLTSDVFPCVSSICSESSKKPKARTHPIHEHCKVSAQLHPDHLSTILLDFPTAIAHPPALFLCTCQNASHS